MKPVSDQSIQKQLEAFKTISTGYVISYNGLKLDKNLVGAASTVFKGIKCCPEAEGLLSEISAQYGQFFSHSPTKMRHLFKHQDCSLFIVRIALSFLQRDLISPEEFTDAETEKWTKAMRALHDLIQAIEQASSLMGTSKEFQDAVAMCSNPLLYNRAKVESIQVAQEQKPMIELLIALFEKERDDDLAVLTGEGTKSSLAFLDLLQTVDNPLARDYRHALASCSSMQAPGSVAHVPMQALMSGTVLQDMEAEVEKLKVERGKVMERVKEKRRKTIRAIVSSPSGVPRPGGVELPRSSDEALNKKHRLFVISSELVMESAEKSWRNPVAPSAAMEAALKERLGYAMKEASHPSDIVVMTDGRNKGLKRLAEAQFKQDYFEYLVIFPAAPRFGATSGWMTLLVWRPGLQLAAKSREDPCRRQKTS